ncbi:MAG: SWIM zinc finger family protein [Proteobacteria bacterium]|nr:SWIM zinc finger family protein [Pseudomonadota bacterium]
MTLPAITEKLIESQVDTRSLVRGRRYADAGAVVGGRLVGRTLRASCHGSRPDPYHVEAILDDSGIVQARCSCPVGGQGTCKHVAALLFAYRDAPDAFAPIEGLDEVLEQRSRGQLIELVQLLVRRQPALTDLVVQHAERGESGRNGQEEQRRIAADVSSHDGSANRDGEPVGQSAEHELRQLVEILVRQHSEAAGPSKGKKSLGKKSNWQLLEWLIDYCERRGKNAEALALMRVLFVEKPTLGLYRRARAVASSLHCWADVESEFQAAVADSRYRDLRIRIYLCEDEVAQALAALPPQISFYQWKLVDEVAQAAENSHPEAARALYGKYVEALIERRGRANYRDACRYLQRIRDLYPDRAEDAGWKRYIAGLRERYSRLPALLDELAPLISPGPAAPPSGPTQT